MTQSQDNERTAKTAVATVPVDPTGVLGLDEVLGGGIQRGSLVIVAGPPGGGKTILAHQIAFTAARAGRHTVVLTAFSESTNKLLTHMRLFTFFDQEMVGSTLDLLSVQQLLRQGLDAATDEIVSIVRSAKAELVVLDGFRGVRETAENPETVRRFIYVLSNRLSLLGITLLLTNEANARDAAFFPEATTADVLLGLAFDAVGVHERRTLEVLKMRGAAPLTGLHALTIDDHGISVAPRLEARVGRLHVGTWRDQMPQAGARDAQQHDTADQSMQAHVELEEQREQTGIPGLDALLDGGLVPSSSTLVVGERGVGKSLLGLQFAVQGAHSGQTSLFVSFRETAAQLVRKAAPFTWGADVGQFLQSGRLVVLRTPPVELNADVLADTLLAALDETGAGRLVLDEIGELARALDSYGYANRFHNYLAALIEALRQREVVSLFTHQVAAERRAALAARLGPSVMLTDNLLWLRIHAHAHASDRALAILQATHSSRSEAWHRMTISAPVGVAVSPLTDDDQGEARTRGSPHRATREPSSGGSQLPGDAAGRGRES